MEADQKLELSCRELGVHGDCGFKSINRSIEDMLATYEEHYWRDHHERLTDHMREKIRHLARKIRPL